MESIKVQAMKVAHHGRQADGIFYASQEEGRYPVVVFSHGYNGHQSDFDWTARYLAERGICSFSHTFCGGSTRDESGMPTTEMTIFTEKEDLLAVIDFVKQLEQVDAERIFVFGGSQGGLVTALAAEEIPEELRGMILLFPAFCIADDWNKRFPKEEDIPEAEVLWDMKLGRVFFESLRGFEVFEHVGKYAKNILVMHGDLDPIVALGYSERIVNAYPHVQLEVFKGEGHGFTPKGNERMTELLYEFVKANI